MTPSMSVDAAGFPWDPSLPRRTVALAMGRVVYTEVGDGPPLIFIHGYGDELFTWRYQLRALRDCARLYALDLIGCGFSDKPRLAYTSETFVQCLQQFMDALGIDAATLVGNSLGAAIALCLAQRRPSSVHRLALLGPTIPGVQPAGRFFYLVFWLAHRGRLGAMLLQPGCRAAVRLALRETLADRNLITDELVAYYFELARQPGFAIAFADTARHWHEWMPHRPRVGALRMPVQIIWGEADRVHPVRQAALLETLIPQAQLLKLPACGHWPQSERPAEVNDALRALLSTPLSARRDPAASAG